ncbi:hypothetical protein NE476_30800, partial [Enterocloster bolteae]|nr:hypothetical protein [Enterocloster bolteae]
LSLKKAIRQAESIIYARQREKLQLKCFSSAASSIQEGILSTENGTIVVANQEMGHILNINERLILNMVNVAAMFSKQVGRWGICGRINADQFACLSERRL